jgi:NAD(P)-dependent dehydrogenase (short-subunit alcohol dehydrogenase family)
LFPQRYNRRVGEADTTFSGRGALVFGGGSGLGAAMARALAGRGARVLVADRDGGRAAQVADEIGGEAAEVDVIASAEVEAAVRSAAESPLGLRILVNCAGVAAGTGLLEREGPASWATSSGWSTSI